MHIEDFHIVSYGISSAIGGTTIKPTQWVSCWKTIEPYVKIKGKYFNFLK